SYSSKFGGPQSEAVGLGEFNLGLVSLKAQKFPEAIVRFNKALDIFKRQFGDHAPLVGHTLLGSASAYLGKGDKDTPAALSGAAAEIFGSSTVVPKVPRWL